MENPTDAADTFIFDDGVSAAFLSNSSMILSLYFATTCREVVRLSVTLHKLPPDRPVLIQAPYSDILQYQSGSFCHSLTGTYNSCACRYQTYPKRMV